MIRSPFHKVHPTLGNPASIGVTEVMECCTDTSESSRCVDERERRKEGASGTAIELADGRKWLFAIPTIKAGRAALTHPNVDAPLNRIHDSLVLAKSVELADVFEIAGILLQANYELSRCEVESLLITDDGPKIQSFVDDVLSILFGNTRQSKTYVDWLRVSLLVCGFSDVDIPGEVIPSLLTVLGLQNRLTPKSTLIDACIAAEESAVVEHLL